MNTSPIQSAAPSRASADNLASALPEELSRRASQDELTAMPPRLVVSRASSERLAPPSPGIASSRASLESAVPPAGPLRDEEGQVPLPEVAPFPVVVPVTAAERKWAACLVLATCGVGLGAASCSFAGQMVGQSKGQFPKLLSGVLFGIILCGIGGCIYTQGRALRVPARTPMERHFRNAMIAASVIGVGSLGTGLPASFMTDRNVLIILFSINYGLTALTMATAGGAFAAAKHT